MDSVSPDQAAGQDGEVRAIARLPGLDIAIVHVPACDGAGERVTVTMQAVPLSPVGLDPLTYWMRMAQMAWTPWLALTGSLWAMPRVLGRR
jgi:hypothetical protein